MSSPSSLDRQDLILLEALRSHRCSAKEAADALDMSLAALAAHLTRVREQLGVTSTAAAVALTGGTSATQQETAPTVRRFAVPDSPAHTSELTPEPTSPCTTTGAGQEMTAGSYSRPGTTTAWNRRSTNPTTAARTGAWPAGRAHVS